MPHLPQVTFAITLQRSTRINECDLDWEQEAFVTATRHPAEADVNADAWVEIEAADADGRVVSLSTAEENDAECQAIDLLNQQAATLADRLAALREDAAA